MCCALGISRFLASPSLSQSVTFAAPSESDRWMHHRHLTDRREDGRLRRQQTDGGGGGGGGADSCLSLSSIESSALLLFQPLSPQESPPTYIKLFFSSLSTDRPTFGGGDDDISTTLDAALIGGRRCGGRGPGDCLEEVGSRKRAGGPRCILKVRRTWTSNSLCVVLVVRRYLFHPPPSNQPTSSKHAQPNNE